MKKMTWGADLSANPMTVDVFYDPDRRRWRKVPCMKDWENRATTDRCLVEVWWRKWPCAVPGIPPGRINKVIVDADRHPGGSDGVELFHALAQTRGPFPPHPVITCQYSKKEPARSWLFQYRIGGKTRRLVIGRAPVVRAGRARQIAARSKRDSDFWP
jgi:hypothetical protein